MAFGLTDKDLCAINASFSEFPEIEEVTLFGSRAMGNYKKGSDIDLAVKGVEVSLRTISNLNARLNEKIPLPYMFDVVEYASINTPALIEHIDVHGKVIYRKDTDA
jgi:predicted nucleotidyltransferase